MPYTTRAVLIIAAAAASSVSALGAVGAAAERALMAVRPVAADKNIGTLEKIAEFEGPTVTGIAVSRDGRIFLSFPRWTDPLKYSVAELRDGHLKPYPDAAVQDESAGPTDHLVSIQSVVADARNRLWILDNGTINQGDVIPGAAKLWAVDLGSNEIVQKIAFPGDVVTPNTYLNDIRFDLRLGKGGFGFISDSSPKSGDGIIVVDLATAQSFRRLTGHRSVLPDPGFRSMVEGQPLMEEKTPGKKKPFQVGSDGIAVSADGSKLFYAPLSSRHLYSVDARVLSDRSQSEGQVEATIIDYGDKGTGCDGLETDDHGRLYVTSAEHDAVIRRLADGEYETVVHDPHLLWPDSLAISADDYLYITVNQLERAGRFHGGRDLRARPWVLFRTPIGAGPSLLAQ